MKKIGFSMMVLLLMLALAACAVSESPARVYALKGPTGIGMVGLMAENEGDYEFTLCSAADEIVAAVASGSADIAACPTNLAATL